MRVRALILVSFLLRVQMLLKLLLRRRWSFSDLLERLSTKPTKEYMETAVGITASAVHGYNSFAACIYAGCKVVSIMEDRA